MAYDHGEPMKATFVNVTVIVDDVNDNAPVCVPSLQKVCIKLHLILFLAHTCLG